MFLKKKKFREKRKQSFIKEIKPLYNLIAITESDFVLGKIDELERNEKLEICSNIIDKWEKEWL